jgi:hypothetical protein
MSLSASQRGFELRSFILAYFTSPVTAAGSDGRCNTFQSVDPTTFTLESGSVWLYSIKA